MNHTHHHHSDAVQEESNISRHDHLNTNDHGSMMKVIKMLVESRYYFYLDVFSYGFY
jgi:hypothetical protein